MLLRLVCDDFEICKVQGETPLETITCVTRTPAPESDTDTRTRVHVTLTIICSKHYIALFSSMSFSSHRFLIEGFFNEAISIQVHMSYLLFSPQGFLFGILKTYPMSYLLFPPTGVFEEVPKTYNYNYDPQIIFIVL